MPISYADTQASALKAVQTKQGSGEPLEEENILYPGVEHDTEDMDTWAMVAMSTIAHSPERMTGGIGTLSFLISTRLSDDEDWYKREKLAENCRTALEGQEFKIKDYVSGDGTNEIGILSIREAEYSRLFLHENKIEKATLNFDVEIMEGS